MDGDKLCKVISFSFKAQTKLFLRYAKNKKIKIQIHQNNAMSDIL